MTERELGPRVLCQNVIHTNNSLSNYHFESSLWSLRRKNYLQIWWKSIIINSAWVQPQ